ncbi:B12-binding domain-containing radical SAM protein [Sporosalibacterium faouarense]|uniref:B12-binding domain-containing radical SAM protein n=1 Tax=Sporosalibacterium faouarense TaxID=516123 RepID=UPI00141C7BBF|nr:B12-binding domain-containing radical SAM protein [Sporosalibacterium faouarense]MTI49489.1 DUF4080 domain-containing protein [Bacillota bacterium]
MKILLTTLNSKYIHSSLSIRYLKSYCENSFSNIMVKEFTINQNPDFIAGEIVKLDTDVVAFSCYIWNIENTLQIAETLKMVKPEIKIIFGGPEVSFDGYKVLEDYKYIDYIIYGEGEETFKDLMVSLENGKQNLNNIQGLIYRENSRIIENAPRPLIDNLDDIPSPFKEDLNEYKNKIVYFESSRGCPFNCRFCLSSTINGVRFFSLKRVKSDLKKLIEAEVRQVKFVDRTFNARKEYALDIMRFLIEETKNYKNDINFHFEVTAHLLDEEVLEFLKNVPEGLFQFEIGVQSTNSSTIEAISRKTDLDVLRKVVKKVRDNKNIHQHLDLIAGLPYEDYETFKKSFNDVYSMEPEKLQLGFLKLLKGSELRMDREKYGFKFLDKPPYEVLENNYISYKEILKLKVIEDLVEKYGNEDNFKYSLGFIIKNFYKTAFDFYEDFSIYWEGRNYHTRAHSKKNLYKILYEFFKVNVGSHENIFNEVLKFDYLLNNKSTNLPKYLARESNIEIQKSRHEFLREEENIERHLSNYKGESVKEIIKDVHFEEFSIDVFKLINNDFKLEDNLSNDRVILFVYKNSTLNKCKTFDVTKEFHRLQDGE